MTTSLLIRETPLYVLPTLATRLGLNEAIFIQQLHWMSQQEHYGRMVDGRKWIRNSLTDWHKKFPFFSVPALRRIVKNLQEDGLLLYRDDLNHHGYDKTGWYAVDLEAFEAFENADGLVERLAEINEKRREAVSSRYEEDDPTPLQNVTPLQDETEVVTNCNGGDYKMITTIPKIHSKTSSNISVSEPPVRKADGDKNIELTWGLLMETCNQDKEQAAAIWQLQEAFCESSGIVRPDIDTELGRKELKNDWWPVLLVVLNAASGDLEAAKAGVKTAVTDMLAWKASAVSGPWSIRKKVSGVINAQRRAATAPAAQTQNVTYQHLNAVPVGKLLGM